MRKKFFVFILIGIFLCLLMFSQYINSLAVQKMVNNQDDVKYSDNYQDTIRDCILICEQNGIHKFPYMTGGSLSVLSIPDGEKITISKKYMPLSGFINPIIAGNKIYYEDAWDGSGQGAFYQIKITGSGEKFMRHIYESPIYIIGNKMYYLDCIDEEQNNYAIKVLNTETLKTETVIEDNVTTFIVDDTTIYYYKYNEGALYKLDAENNSKKVLKKYIGSFKVLDILLNQDGNIFFRTEKNEIIMYDQRKSSVDKVVENEYVANSNENYYGYKQMHIVENKLYYIDDDMRILQKNLLDGETKKVLEFGNINCFKWKEASVKISWSKNYIICQVAGYTQSNQYKAGIVAFDYEGNEVYRNAKMQGLIF